MGATPGDSLSEDVFGKATRCMSSPIDTLELRKRNARIVRAGYLS